MAPAEMSPEKLQARSYALAKDQYLTAVAVAEIAIEEMVDYGTQVELWGEDEWRYLAELERRVRISAQARRNAENRLLWEFTNYINSMRTNR